MKLKKMKIEWITVESEDKVLKVVIEAQVKEVNISILMYNYNKHCCVLAKLIHGCKLLCTNQCESGGGVVVQAIKGILTSHGL